MAQQEIIILLFLASIVWFWSNGMRAREAGLKAVRKTCESEGLQLLDDAIFLLSVKPEKDQRGRWALRRVYRFEFSDTGDNRRQGSVHLIGEKVVLLDIGLLLQS